jgi:hypothetical protein
MLPGYPYWSDRVIVRISWNNYLKALCIVKHTMKKKAVLLSSLCSRLVAKGPLWMSGNAGLTATSYMPSHSLSLHWHLLLWNKQFPHCLAFCTATPGILNWINTSGNWLCKTCLQCLKRLKQNCFYRSEKRERHWSADVQTHVIRKLPDFDGVLMSQPWNRALGNKWNKICYLIKTITLWLNFKCSDTFYIVTSLFIYSLVCCVRQSLTM